MSQHAATAAPAYLDAVEQTEGWLSLDEAELLHDLAAAVTQGVIVEVGAYRGRSTIALSAGAPSGTPVFAVDPHAEMVENGKTVYGPQDRAAFFESMVRSGAFHNVRLLNTSSEIITPGWRDPVGLLWIDGEHTYEAARRDWDCWQPHLIPGAVVVFDDAHDPTIGPFKLINELLETGIIEHRKNIGKVRSVFYRPVGNA